MGKKYQNTEELEEKPTRKVLRLKKIRKKKKRDYYEDNFEGYDIDEYKDMFMSEEDLEKLPHDPFDCYSIPKTKKEHKDYIYTLISESDIILEVVDARNPFDTQINTQITDTIKEDKSKKIVLLLNKIDLVTPSDLQKKIDELKKNNLIITCSTYNREKVEDMYNQLKSIVEQHLSQNQNKKNVKIGIIGYPNMGKNSIINSIKLLEGADCLDRFIYFDENKSFGINSIFGTCYEKEDNNSMFFSKSEKKIENIKNPQELIKNLINCVDKNAIQLKYKIIPNTLNELITAISQKYSFNNDINKVSFHILKELLNGTINYSLNNK